MIFLEEPRRQSDQTFFRVLNKIRFGIVDEEVKEVLTERWQNVWDTTMYLPVLATQRSRSYEPHCTFGNAPGQGCYV